MLLYCLLCLIYKLDLAPPAHEAEVGYFLFITMSHFNKRELSQFR